MYLPISNYASRYEQIPIQSTRALTDFSDSQHGDALVHGSDVVVVVVREPVAVTQPAYLQVSLSRRQRALEFDVLAQAVD